MNPVVILHDRLSNLKLLSTKPFHRALTPLLCIGIAANVYGTWQGMQGHRMVHDAASSLNTTVIMLVVITSLGASSNQALRQREIHYSIAPLLMAVDAVTGAVSLLSKIIPG